MMRKTVRRALPVATARGLGARVRAVVFGDRYGVLLFLGALVFFGLYWRIGIFVTDNWTLANTLLAVADGHLHVEETAFGPPGANLPGYHVVDDRVYGRNYGQLFLAVPVLYLLQAASAVVDIRIAIAGAWSLLLMAFAVRVGAEWGRREAFAVLGSVAGLVAFAVNVALATPMPARWPAVVALQVTNMALAALIGVVLYRLLAAMHDRRTGLFIGAVAVLATPVGFWASLPKRHVLVSLLAVVTLFAFYRSRAVYSNALAIRYRVLAYASVGYWAWVHAAEALVMLVVLASIDLLTARSYAPRRLAAVVVGFLLSLVPFFLTNWLISGNPLVPPRFLERYSRYGDSGGREFGSVDGGRVVRGDSLPGSGDGSQGADIGASLVTDGSGGLPADAGGLGLLGGPGSSVPQGVIGTDAGPGIGRLLDALPEVLAPLPAAVKALLDLFAGGLDVVLNEPGRLVQIFLVSAPAETRAWATDLALLESTPIFGVLLAVPAYLAFRSRLDGGARGWVRSPRGRTDLFALAFVLALTLLYLSRLPTQALWTVRYLLPIVPFGLYFVGRLEPLRAVVAERVDPLVYSYAGLVLLGGQLWIVYLAGVDPILGEAVQWHGTLGVVAASIAGAWIVVAEVRRHTDARIGAVAIALPLAAGTLFVLLSGLEYFVVGEFALALAERLSDALPIF